MSRSYRKPTYYIEGIKPSTVKSVKRLSNKQSRLKLKQSFDLPSSSRSYYRHLAVYSRDLDIIKKKVHKGRRFTGLYRVGSKDGLLTGEELRSYLEEKFSRK